MNNFGWLILMGGSAFVLVFGAWRYHVAAKRSDTDKTQADELAALILDALYAFSKRILSAVFQLIVYASLVLGMFFLVFNRSLPWSQLGGQLFSFALGSIVMIFSTLFGLRLFPKVLVNVLSRSQTFLEDGLRTVWDAGMAI